MLGLSDGEQFKTAVIRSYNVTAMSRFNGSIYKQIHNAICFQQNVSTEWITVSF